MVIVMLAAMSCAGPDKAEIASQMGAELVATQGAKYGIIDKPTVAGKTIGFTLLVLGEMENELARLKIISAFGKWGADYRLPWQYNEESERWEGWFMYGNIRVDVWFKSPYMGFSLQDS
jgi:hypothetical protein